MDVGFIGLGNMGFPMARRLIQENHNVIAFDTRSAAQRSSASSPSGRAPRHLQGGRRR